jgi:putative heme-binding domain-containing protein
MKLASVAVATVMIVFASTAQGEGLELKKGDHICIIGNTLAERMQHQGWLETLIQARFPAHELVFRNLGFSGDEIELDKRLRSMSFGMPDEWLAGDSPVPQPNKLSPRDEVARNRFELTNTKADVIFAFFGYNESFGGAAGLPKFRQDLEAFIRHSMSQKYNGKSAPRLVLFSPIAQEPLPDPSLPGTDAVAAANVRIGKYAAAMHEVAATNRVMFVDLFGPTSEQYLKQIGGNPLTINGIHLNATGDRFVAAVADTALFGPRANRAAEVDLERLRRAVNDKNFYWFNRYRTTDGYSTYGDRAFLKFSEGPGGYGEGRSNYGTVQRELEVLDIMTSNRDRRVWAAAQGKELAVTDGNLPPYFPVISNKPGPLPGGKHVFLGGEEAIAKMTVHQNMKVTLFASEENFPEMANPVQMAFDARGRLWVAAWPNYPHWIPTEPMNDKLLILEDTDGDGKADVCKTFAGDLTNPTGFEFWNGGVIVAQGPDILFLKDTNGDDKYDVKERILHGLDTADTHHTANSFVLDPGGALYFQEGTFHRTQVETAWGPPERCADAGVFRYEPRTQKFEVYVSYPFANPHGHAFDAWGQDFVFDGTSSDPFHAVLFSGHMDFPHKHARPPTVYRQRTRPCSGVEILSSRHFPDEFQGNLLVNNVIGFQGILQYKLADEGSSFSAVEAEPIVSSSDPNFRPADVEIGPDGAIWFTDWQNPIIGHMQHNLRDPSRDRIHGRVYRVTYEGRPLVQPVAVAGEPIEKLLELLRSPEDRVRSRARIELSGRPTRDVIAAAKKWIAGIPARAADYDHARLEALWLHQSHNVVDEPLLRQVLRLPDFRARAAATRVIVAWRDRLKEPLQLLQAQAEDEHPRVRLEAVRGASFFRDGRAADVALAALKRPTDTYINFVLNETMRTLEPYWKAAVAAGHPLTANNPAGAEYLLAKVTTAELVKLPRTASVFQALLSRDGVLPDNRKEALDGLAKINNTDVLTELFAAIKRIDGSENAHAAHVLSDLASLLATRPAQELSAIRSQLETLAAGARQPVTRRVAFVTLASADGTIDGLWKSSSKSIRSLTNLIDAIPLIPDGKVRGAAYAKVEPLLHKLPDDLAAQVKKGGGTAGRYVRVQLPGAQRTLTLAEVEVLSDGVNIARQGKATQSSTAHGGVAERAIDGDASGSYGSGHQTHTNENSRDPWWQVDLGSERPIDAAVIWNRTDGELGKRLDGFSLVVRDANGQAVFEKTNISAPDPSVRLEIGGDAAGAIRRSAMNAVAAMPGHEAAAFRTLAAFIVRGDERAAAVRAIRRIPRAQWPGEEFRPLLAALLAHVSSLSAEARTEPAGLDELQLGKDLASLLPAKEAKDVLGKIGELGVNVILIRTVPHKMIYDRSKIYVEAGKPAVIVLENGDLMPHNLLIGAPGSLVEIGLAAEKMATEPDGVAKNFVPNSPNVLQALRMVQPGESLRLMFTAPTGVGEYPYVCTFPGHWRLMYGTMHVVPKLADISPDELNPPTEVIAEGRPFVRKWTVEELVPELHHLAHGRSFERGKALFTAATCVKCHKMAGQGGDVGPELAEVKKKIADKKHTPESVLREMIEPSKVIDPKFKTYIIETKQGAVVAGLIVGETGDAIKIRSSPDAEPREVPLSDIDERIESKLSLMPEGLLVTLSKEEILDLLAYVLAAGDSHDGAYGDEHK